MSSGDGEQGAIPPTQEKMAEMMEALMRRQEQRFQDMVEARMTRAGAREGGDYSGKESTSGGARQPLVIKRLRVERNS